MHLGSGWTGIKLPPPPAPNPRDPSHSTHATKVTSPNNICIYVVSCSVFLPPPPHQWYGSPSSTPSPSICKLLAAFLRSSLVFARSLQHFWLPASHLLGTCYLLDDLRSTHTPSKYLRATCSHKYMCYVSTSYVLPVYSYNTTCV